MSYEQRRELYQEGAIGLTYAARKYDPNKGVKFSTYSSYWIKSYLSSHVKKRYKLHNTTELNEEITGIEYPDQLDLRFLNTYEVDIIESYYMRRETQISIAKRNGVGRHRIKKHLRETLAKIRREYGLQLDNANLKD